MPFSNEQGEIRNAILSLYKSTTRREPLPDPTPNEIHAGWTRFQEAARQFLRNPDGQKLFLVRGLRDTPVNQVDSGEIRLKRLAQVE